MSSSSSFQDIIKLPENAPFSVRDIRNVIPKHCFERSYVKSFSYIVHDLCIIATLFYAASYIPLIPYMILRIIARTLYWYAQGAFLTGIWVIAHECGHQAFSPSKFVNNAVGFVLHTMLLVPYFSWQYTHFQHHARTNNLIEDTVHVPRMKYAKRVNLDTIADINEALNGHKQAVPYSLNPTPMSSTKMMSIKKKNRSLLSRIVRVLNLTVLGWPTYLFMNFTGSPKYDFERFTNHFNPFSVLFPSNIKPYVLLSDIGLFFWVFILYRIACVIGFIPLLNYYLIPYLIVNFWLVTITFLHHTDTKIVRYMPSEWNWMRGAFGTIDRDYGWFLNYAHHHISDTHLVHHLFSKMPHYHAVEATKAIEKSGILGKYHLHSSETFYSALWNSIGCGRWCVEVGNEQFMMFER
jgi:omega-6 fatty acid desaturase (delta-12 desaturase)